MNFGNPQRPEIMGQFVGCVEGMAEACRVLDFPIVSGNVSLYNETKNEDGAGSAILPTPAIGGVGLIEDWEKAATIGFKAEGEAIILIGHGAGHVGQSLWLRECHGREEGPPPPVDLAAERVAGELVRGLVENGSVTAVHDCSDGGAAVALAEMALAGGTGAVVGVPASAPLAPVLFGEDQGRYLVTTKDAAVVLASAQAKGVFAAAIGSTGGNAIVVEHRTRWSVPLADLRGAHEGFFRNLMRNEPAVA
jgi:phosphoribosylformylglycinamidine synthase